jgi:multiple sugar transport system substrate-binding protein
MEPLQNKLSRRTVLAHLATLGLALPSLALGGACSPAEPVHHAADNAANGAAQPAAASGAISFIISGDPVDEAAYNRLLTAFQETTSDVAVDLINMPALADLYRRLVMDFASGTPADVSLVSYRRYAAFAAKKVLEELEPYLAASSLIQAADFYELALGAFTWRQKLFGIPQNVASLVVYYNKDIFDQAGVAYPIDAWNWDEFLEIARALTLDHDGDGSMNVWGLGTDAITLRVAPFIWMSGGDLVDNPQQPTQLALDTPEARRALAWFVALQTEHQVVPDPLTEKAESHEARFVNGRLAMYLESRRVTPSLRLNTTFDWDIAPLPQRDVRSTVLHSDGFCLAAQSQNKAAAWALIEYANSPAGQTVLSQTGRVVPSQRQVATSPAFLNPTSKPAHNQLFLDSMGYMHSLPIMPTWSNIEAGIGRELELAFHGDSTLDAAIDAAYIRTREFFTP